MTSRRVLFRPSALFRITPFLGYYTTNTAQNGHVREVKVSLSTPLDAKLGYREGCFADKQFSHFTAVDKEQQLEDALMLEDPVTDLSFAMEIDSFQLNRAEYLLPEVFLLASTCSTGAITLF